ASASTPRWSAPACRCRRTTARTPPIRARRRTSGRPRGSSVSTPDVSTPEGIAAPRATTARKPRRGDVVLVRVDGFDARGAATGTSSDYRIRLRRGLPGELVRARVIRRRRARIDAVTLERLEESPRRVPPRCAHFGICGGCAFQDLDYAAQLEGKRA